MLKEGKKCCSIFPVDQLEIYDNDKNGIKIKMPEDLPAFKMMPEFIYRIM